MLYLLISGYFKQLVQPISYQKEKAIRKVIVSKMRLYLFDKNKIDIVY